MMVAELTLANKWALKLYLRLDLAFLCDTFVKLLLRPEQEALHQKLSNTIRTFDSLQEFIYHILHNKHGLF